MNALAKFSIAVLLLAASAVGIYLYLGPRDEGRGAARSPPQSAACKQDEERLARLRAHPSLNEGLNFVSEIRCMQLWPQLQTVMDGLSGPSHAPAPSPTSETASNATSAGHVEATPAPLAQAAALEDACRHDEDRLAELQAHPSVDAAIRFDSELKCPKLQPQLPTILAGLSTDGESGGAAKRAASPRDTEAAGATKSTASDLPSPEAKSATQDDACKQDEGRLVALQAKPTLAEAARFVGELTCSRLQPQLLAVLDGLSQAQQQAGAPTPAKAPADVAAIQAAAPPAPAPHPASEISPTNPASATPSNETPASETVPRPAEALAEAKSATLDDTCKPDEERLAALQAKPSLEEAVRFQGELKCSRLEPQLLAVLDGLSQAQATKASLAAEATNPSAVFSEAPSAGAMAAGMAKPSAPESASVANVPDAKSGVKAETPSASDAPVATQAALDADRRVAALESEKAVLAEKVSQLERDLNAASAPRVYPSGAPPSTGPAPQFESAPASQAAADAERRIAQLESQQEALTAKVNQLERDRDAASAKPDARAAPPEPPADQQSAPESAQATVQEERRIAELQSEKDALTAEVGRLQSHDDAPPAGEANAPAAPQPAVPALPSRSDPAAALPPLPEGIPGRVLIRYLANNADARAQAEKLAKALKELGIEVADLRASAGAIRTELSFSYAPDEAIAREVGRLAGVAPVRRIQPKDGLMVRPGTIELNLSGEGRAAAIKTTLRRESNHE